MYQFTFAEAAHAADVPVATLRDWFSARTGAFAMQPEKDDIEAPAGGVRRLSENSVIAVAIAAALARRGVPLRHAAQAGLMFAHTAGGTDLRAIGKPYTGAVATILAVDAKGEAHLFPAGQGPDLKFLEIVGEQGATFVNASCIYHRVKAALEEITGAIPRSRKPA
jgi:hypothetical protein